MHPVQNKTVQGQTMSNEKLQRRTEVLERTGLSNSTMYYFINEGTFPKPVKLGKRTVAWKKSEIDEWIESRQYSVTISEELDQDMNEKGGKKNDNE
jgi:prophage regulatory protein